MPVVIGRLVVGRNTDIALMGSMVSVSPVLVCWLSFQAFRLVLFELTVVAQPFSFS